MATPVLAPELLRHQRRMALWSAALVTPFAAVDALQDAPGLLVAIALLARAAWVAALLAGAWLLSPPAPRARAATTLMTAASAGAAVAIVYATGGSRSGYFAFLLALPVCMQILLPGSLAAATGSGLASVLAGGWMLVASGAAPQEVLRWIGTGVGISALAAYATRSNGALFRREVDAARASAEASAALAVSERRRAVTERLATVGRLAAGVAHEINNPLGSVKSNVAFAREVLCLPGAPAEGDRDEARQALSDALAAVERIRRIVLDLRGLAQEDDEPCGTDPARAIEEALRLAAPRTRGLSVRLDVAGDLPAVRICRKHLVQALLNLVVNAADAVEEAAERRRWIAVSAAAHPDGASIRVDDGGGGLAPEALARLFEPFFTTKPPGRGTGLGLALAHEYVTAVGGRIAGANGPGGGARFELTLPRQAQGRARCAACSHADAAGAHAACA